ncbi:MAG: glutathione S-transferase family protein [Alphaproteobacteria bacterium]
MGQMVDGQWRREDQLVASGDRFERAATKFHGRIEPGGRFPPEAGRYHLYVSLACPWAHRALILRKLKKLEGMISLSVTHWLMAENGWSFEPGEGVVPDAVGGARYLHEVYAKADPNFTGRVTVPVLLDKRSGQIVNNESSEIIRFFNSAFDAVGAAPGDFYPEPLRAEIDRVNARVYDTLNNGVYKAGFARSQAAYEAAVGPLFDTTDWLEDRLSHQPFLCGDIVTEADWRLFTTLVRFDAAYHGHFKCNLRRLIDYPALWDYARALYQVPGVAETVDLGHIKRHYYMSHTTLNPSRIVPIGPALDFGAPVSQRRAAPSWAA